MPSQISVHDEVSKGESRDLCNLLSNGTAHVCAWERARQSEEGGGKQGLLSALPIPWAPHASRRDFFGTRGENRTEEDLDNRSQLEDGRRSPVPGQLGSELGGIFGNW